MTTSANQGATLSIDLENTFKECLGALSIIKDGWETEALPQISRKNNKKNGFFSKIFS